jgi:hypothetical protein
MAEQANIPPEQGTIRVFGDPVLEQVAARIDNVDGKLISLAEDMFRAMYEAPGLGLAAPQIGIQRQIFVWDIDDNPQAIINPTIVESSGEWVYDEGCLSIPRCCARGGFSCEASPLMAMRSSSRQTSSWLASSSTKSTT